MRKLAVVVVFGLVLAAFGACGTSDVGAPAIVVDAAVPPPDAPPPPPPPADTGPGDAGRAELRVGRILPWVGGGMQFIVEVPPELRTLTPVVLREDGSTAPSAIAPVDAATGLSLILFLPSTDATTHAARVAAALAILNALPTGERVAIYSAGTAVEAGVAPAVISDFALERGHAQKRLQAAPATAVPADPKLVPTVRGMLDGVESKFGPVARSLIVVGATGADEPGSQPRTVHTFTMPVSGAPAADATALVAQIADRRSSFMRIGVCGPLAESQSLGVTLGSGYLSLGAPPPMDHVAALPCSAADAAADKYPYPEDVELIMTVEQRTVYDSLYTAKSELPFAASVRLGKGTTVLPATVHFRGQSTLACARKSLNIEIAGPRRRLMPEVAQDKLLLVSMCLDDRYFRQVWANRLLTSLGLQETKSHYARVLIDGKPAGVYMMTERPEDALRDGGLATQAVVRRRYDIKNQPADVKYSLDPTQVEQERLRFETLGDQVMTDPDDTLEGMLDTRMDLDRYLQILATFSLLENGDYIDEAWFWAANEAGQEYYRAMGWDTDDTQKLCHGSTMNPTSIVDACKLTYCAEAELDRALIRSPAVYARYKKALTRVLNDLQQPRMIAEMDATTAELFAAIDSDATAAAMTELVAQNPLAKTKSGAQTDITSKTQAALVRIGARWSTLQSMLATCAF